MNGGTLVKDLEDAIARQVGELPEELRSRINTLSSEQLKNLGEELLEFEAIADLEAWFGNLE